MGIWPLIFLRIAASLFVNFQGDEKNPGFRLSKKFAMYKIGDMFGMDKPYMNVTVEEVEGEGNYFGIIAESLLLNLKYENFEALCKFNNNSFEKIEKGKNVYKKIDESGLYAVVVLVCKPELEFKFVIESKNPFGQLTGDYVLLIPFYGVLSGLYLFLFLFWCVSLCIYHKYAISVQKYCIPAILAVCIAEHSLNFWYWEFINLTGSQSWILLITSIILKGLRDSAGRSLLMAASHGWGIVNDNPPYKNYIIYCCGFTYFIFDIVYEASFKLYYEGELWVLIIATLPLILTNSIIFYFVFAWFVQSFVRLRLMRQVYKLGLIKKFSFILILGAVISVLWTLVEVFTKVFLHIEEYWKVLWLYIGIWDLIFLLMVISFMVVWKVDEKSELLANSYQVQVEEDLSYEQEEGYGIELPRINK